MKQPRPDRVAELSALASSALITLPLSPSRPQINGVAAKYVRGNGLCVQKTRRASQRIGKCGRVRTLRERDEALE